MKVSLNTIKQFTAVDLPVDELVTKINEQLGGVEETIDFATRYKDALIVRIVECVKHPDADKLSVCTIDDGGAVKDIERDKNGHVQVVCGAPNARAGIFVVWLPPASTVPSSYGSKEGIFTLDARKLRGVMSYGMLAGADELGLSDKHETILEIDPSEWKPSSDEIQPGANFAIMYGLNDTIIDIENKMFTHRPDCFGQIGVAREIAGIQGKPFTSPTWYVTKNSEASAASGAGLPLTVRNEAMTNVPRLMAVAVRDITVKPSPLWLQCELVRLGGKPINNIVDVTNYIMLLTGQPLHAYDYDKLRGATLGARQAKEGEKLPLLNGKTYQLTPEDTVIVDGEGPVGLGGVMGGGNSEVSDATKNIVLECATFDMYAVRKTSMRHGLFTDAVTRYTKGQSPLQNPYIIALALQSIFDTAGGQRASEIFDEGDIKVSNGGSVDVSVDFINDRLGLKLEAEAIKKILENVEFAVAVEQKEDSNSHTARYLLHITYPFWRTDIQLPEDIVEEVGRLYGFDKLPRELPRRSMKPASKNQVRVVKQLIRESLQRAGANEAVTYSFVHANVIKRAEQDVSQAFKLGNALSPDLQYYRLSVLPSLLDKVHGNVKSGHDEFALYEIGKGHNKKDHATDADGLPGELTFVDLVYTSKRPQTGAAYYHVQTLLTALCSELGFTIRLKPVTTAINAVVAAPFELDRSAIVESNDGVYVGIIGELKQTVLSGFKLPAYTAAMSLDLDGLCAAVQQTRMSYKPLSRYPKVTQDISLKVAADALYASIVQTANDAVTAAQPDNSSVTLQVLGIYQPSDNVSTKTITLRLEITNYDRTLTDGDVVPILDAVAAATAHDAERV